MIPQHPLIDTAPWSASEVAKATPYLIPVAAVAGLGRRCLVEPLIGGNGDSLVREILADNAPGYNP